ncbi:aromatic ring-hydroxylating oxygenase subunit alpha [Leisingera sp. ANG-DT]|uniref:aromatic ring-hydroxylating oxygenase subunit alpha n=1 Tax=Leisingera sp. ANG-DT TaxID=1577897 RepID=UPI00057EB736|nr:aromatic ring-hydroxylating dioxygenase subunit alpha [Leisingera sp. ANG-DT]KIC17149.1 ribosomal subunit interface protein [Leisingera sp. ANG-DT]
MPKDDLQVMRELMESHREGFALDRHFYTSEAVYDHDIKMFWNRNWIWVGHVSQISEPGDYFLFDYGPESVIVVRDREGEVRAHLNVCRHRGSRVCLEKQGTARVFSCPYHAWTFGLDGKLRGGRAMGPDFDPSDYGLFPVQVQIFQGLIFICADENPPPLADSLDRLAPLSAPMGLENLKLAHEASYPVPANWKLALENYLECYHCAPSHQDYSRSHSLKDPADVEKYGADLRERSASIGLPVEELDLTGPNAQAPGSDVYWRRYPLFPGYQTGSRDGEPLAPPLGALSGHDGGATDLAIGTLNYFLIYADHLVGYRFVPRGLQETDIQIAWYVRGDAEEGRDYDKEALTWLWHVTSLDDERIIRHNQEGVNSHRFAPGPLSEMEWSLPGFYRSYFNMI